LIVDDEPGVRAALARVLRRDGYEIFLCASGEEGLSVLRQRPVDVIISDHLMPGMRGIDFLGMARLVCPDAVRILLTAHADLPLAARAINEDAVYRLLLKPWDGLDLRVLVRLALEHSEGSRRSNRLLAMIREKLPYLGDLAAADDDLFVVDRDLSGAILVAEEDGEDAA
jgi:response regulator RpfG family c-di-GMP phosphodiesterase